MLAGLHERGFTDLVAAHLDVFQYPGPENERPLQLATQTRMTKQALNYLLGQLQQLGYLTRAARPARPTLQAHPPNAERPRRDQSDPRNRPRRRSRVGTPTGTTKVRPATPPTHPALRNRRHGERRSYKRTAPGGADPADGVAATQSSDEALWTIRNSCLPDRTKNTRPMPAPKPKQAPGSISSRSRSSPRARPAAPGDGRRC